MKKYLILITIFLLPIFCFSQKHNNFPWYEKRKNYFLDAVGVSNTLTSVGGGISVIKNNIIFGVEYDHFQSEELSDVFKTSLHYSLPLSDNYLFLFGGCYNYSMNKNNPHNKISIEMGVKRCIFDKIQMAITYDYSFKKCRIFVYYDL